jgi:uncharacterized damage-inducible protein DinB
MARVTKWFDRKFEFAFPVELYPDLIVRLRGTPARLEEILRQQPHELLVHKPQQKWSAQEHAGHLLTLEPLWLARVEDFVNGADQLSATDLANRPTEEANYNARKLQNILMDFRDARTGLVERASRLDSALFGRTILHPRLKQPMRLVDHLYFVAEHDDHHLAKIWELIAIQG